MAWAYLAYFVVAMIISYALSPKPQTQPPPGVGEIQAPTAEVGRDIPVLFGTRDLKAPNVTWYGDVRVVPIRSKGGKK